MPLPRLYLGLLPTLLRQAGECWERHRQVTHPVTVKPEMVAFEPNGVWSNITRHQGKIINELSTVIVSRASGAVKSSSN